MVFDGARSLLRPVFYNAGMRPEDFAAAVNKTVLRFDMDLARPLAMVSGGPDSVAMLRVLLEIGAEPVVLHMDHGLRGEESREDAEFVRVLCENLSVPYEARRIELSGGNLQEEAREERYRLAEELAEEQGLSAIVTGHTAGDVAETVLMNLARGAGLRGLSGIPPVRGKVMRPLIERRRSEILDYLQHLDQPYRTDSTNLTTKYARNRVRLEVLPILEELYPGAAANMARAATFLREDLSALEDLAAEAVRWRGEEVVVSLDALEGMSPALRRHAVRRAYSTLAPEAAPLASAAVAGALKLMQKGEGTRTIQLPNFVILAARLGRELAFYRGAQPVSTQENLLPGAQGFERWLIESSNVRCFDPEDASRRWVAYLDAEKGPYGVRMARGTDNIRPLGLGGTKKVYKALRDRRVPRDLWLRTPVLVDGEGKVAWIFGGEISEDHKAAEKLGRFLRVEVEKVL